MSPDDVTASGSQRSIEGWILRVDSQPDLKDKIANTQRRDVVYAAEGLWYDALHDLAIQRQQQPQNLHLKTDWHDLLQETPLRSQS